MSCVMNVQAAVLVRRLLAAHPQVGQREQIVARRGAGRAARPEPLGPILAHQPFDLVGESEVGELGGVGDEAEDGAVDVAGDRLEHARRQVAPERPPLAIDVAVVAATEVDPLEGALARAELRKRRLGEALEAHAAVAAHDERVAGLERLHALRRDVEDRHQRGALAGDRDHVVVDVVEAGADAGGIAAGERVAVADEPAERIAAVPVVRGLGEDAGDVQLAGDLGGEGAALELAEGFRTERGAQPIVLAVERVADALEHHLGVALADRVQSVLHEPVEELRRVGHVEVAGQRKVPARGVVAAQEGMARLLGVAAEGAVAQVPEVDLAEERNAPLELDLAERVELEVREVAQRPHGVVEEPLDRVPLGRPRAVDEGVARWHVELHDGDAGAVLAAVVLLLHQQVEAPQAPRHVVVHAPIMIERPAQPDEREAAFVMEWIGHRGASTDGLDASAVVLAARGESHAAGAPPHGSARQQPPSTTDGVPDSEFLIPGP
ncbi:MAG: hypothetical protein U0575_11785 [Phycisphaerales bacterium]